MQILMNNTQEAILSNFDQTMFYIKQNFNHLKLPCLYNINENKQQNDWLSHLIVLYSLMYKVLFYICISHVMFLLTTFDHLLLFLRLTMSTCVHVANSISSNVQ